MQRQRIEGLTRVARATLGSGGALAFVGSRRDRDRELRDPRDRKYAGELTPTLKDGRARADPAF